MRFLVSKTVRRVERTGTITIDLNALSIHRNTWVADMLALLAGESEKRPRNSSEIERLKWALRLLADSEVWQAAVNALPASLTVEDLGALFAVLESRIECEAWATTTKRNTSSEFRKVLRWYLDLKTPGSSATRSWADLRRTRFRTAAPRQLISDLPNSVSPRHLVGALPHVSIAELRSKTQRLLREDLDHIERACLTELARFEAAANWLAQESKEEISEDLRRDLDRCLSVGSKEGLAESLRRFPAPALLRLYLAQSHSGKPDAALPPFGLSSYVCCKEVFAYAARNVDLSRVRPSQLFIYPFLGDGVVLMCCLLLIQIRTGWNASSVLSLSEAEIQRRGEQITIQGFKPRSDDYTPHVVLQRSDSANKALETLTYRLNHLRRLGLVNSTTTCLWQRAASRAGNGRASLFQNFQRPKEWLCEKYALPKFSFDQLRTQVLATTSATTGGLELARRLGGHASASTTAHYLDQVLMHRLNSSINLEFQRKIEQSIHYIDSKATLPTPGPEPDGFLLYPTGDGSSCSDPSKPPSSGWLIGNLCEATRCHVNGGCPNRKLVVDAARVEELCATTLFYELHWSDLMAENREAFEVLHLPAILFNAALRGIVEKGPYGPLLRLTLSNMRKQHAEP